MLRRPLGRSGTEVTAVGLGAVSLSIEGRPDEAQAVRVIHAALDAGIEWIDTADAYCLDERDVGHGERLVRRALDEWSGPRERVRVTTKGGYVRPNGEWRPNGNPEHLRSACEASLRALGVDAIWLYQLHLPDPKVQFPDSVGALEDLRREGKIRHIGLSNVDVGHIEAARKVAPIASVQNSLSPFDRRAFANGVLELCERTGIAFVAHSPVGGHARHRRVAEHPVLRAVAACHGATPYEVTLAWLLSTSRSMLVIPGASRVESAVSSARAADLALTPADVAELRRAFPPAGFVVKQLVSARRVLRTFVRELRRGS